MINVKTADLRAHWGKFIRLIKSGETIIVTSHQNPVAKLSPFESNADTEGILKPDSPLEDLLNIEGIRYIEGIDGVAMLLKDRGRR